MRLHRLALAVLAFAGATAAWAQADDAALAEQLASCAPSLAVAARAPDTVKLQLRRGDAATAAKLAVAGTQALLGPAAADLLLRRKFSEFDASLPHTLGPQLIAAIDGPSVPCAKLVSDNFEALKPRIESARAKEAERAKPPAVIAPTAPVAPATPAAPDDKKP